MEGVGGGYRTVIARGCLQYAQVNNPGGGGGYSLISAI